jgi:hypothetical protein
MSPTLSQKLSEFRTAKQVFSKGKLATVLFLTRRVSGEELPFALEKLRTAKQGQVAGLGRDAVQKILAEHGLKRVLAEEGGRTSRGSLGLSESYVAFLNELQVSRLLDRADLPAIEAWWVGQIRDLFNRQSFKINLDSSLSVSALVSALLESARGRQSEMEGLRVEGAVLHYLVGAKLRLAYTTSPINVRGFNVADDSTLDKGDYTVGETVVHVSTAPSDKLLEKCTANIADGLRPLIVCPKAEVAAVLSLANRAGLRNRLEVFDVEMFVSANLNERGLFAATGIQQSTRDLIAAYNDIIEAVESDRSLKIEAQ